MFILGNKIENIWTKDKNYIMANVGSLLTERVTYCKSVCVKTNLYTLSFKINDEDKYFIIRDYPNDKKAFENLKFNIFKKFSFSDNINILDMSHSYYKDNKDPSIIMKGPIHENLNSFSLLCNNKNKKGSIIKCKNMYLNFYNPFYTTKDYFTLFSIGKVSSYSPNGNIDLISAVSNEFTDVEVHMKFNRKYLKELEVL